ncbi:MAG: hypothetical protein KJ749_02840, partial [Planctomycetes bacterium]|nr:hypothetical protein [Planctomycetota bacterium]
MDTSSTIIGRIKKLPARLFGTRNDRILKVYRRQALPVNEVESEIRGDFDERFARRLAEEGLDDCPEEEREAVKQRLRVELCEDLRERTAEVKDRIRSQLEPLDSWWRQLHPGQRVQEYYRAEYRKRDAKMIEALDREG